LSIADQKYKHLLLEILEEGEWDTDGDVRPVYKDGTPAHTKSIFGKSIEFKEGEVPIITSKHTPVQTSINEVIHWFFRLKSTDVNVAKELGIKYWNAWKLDDDTIGRSYSYQLREQEETLNIYGKEIKLDQVDNILYRLEHDPYSRRIMFAYWNPNDVHLKSLQECAWSGQFNVRNGRLDFILTQRSVDTLLGLPTNWAGYYALQCALANVFGYKVGKFVHHMGNVHLYDNQIELAKELLNEKEYPQPQVYVNPSIDNFYDYGLEDVKVINYEHGKKYRSEVAI